MNKSLDSFAPDHYITEDCRLDFVVIFDCGISFPPVAVWRQGPRRVDFLSAGWDRDSSSSLTSKILEKVRRRTKLGDPSVEMAELIEELKGTSHQKNPSYTGISGIGSVVLPLSQSAINTVRWKSQPEYMTTFSVRLAETLSDKEVEEFVDWLSSDPKFRSVGLRLEAIKKTVTMVLIFEIRRLCFMRIFGLPGIQEICKNERVDYSWALHRRSGITRKISSP